MRLMDRRRELMAKKHQAKAEYFFNTGKFYKISNGAGAMAHSGKAVQGGCVAKGKWFSLTITEDNSTQYLYSFDLTTRTFTLLQTYTKLYHANSLTYNPTADEFYVATGYAEYGYAVIDGSDYSLKQSVVAKRLDGTAFTPWNVAYDRKRGLIYCNLGGILCINSTDGTCIAERTFTNYVTRTTAQGMETDGEFIYMCWSSPANVIDVYTIGGKFVKTVALPTGKELEEIGYDWAGRWYAQEFYNTGYTRFWAILFRTYNGWANMAYAPFPAGKIYMTRGTIVFSDVDALTITSNGAANYSLYVCNPSTPFGYTFLNGKTCRISYTLKRLSGSGTNISVNTFTTNKQDDCTMSDRLWWKTDNNGSRLTVNETMNVSYEFVWGEDSYIPTSGNEGTYIGVLIFLYAASGNSFEIKDFKYEVDLSSLA